MQQIKHVDSLTATEFEAALLWLCNLHDLPWPNSQIDWTWYNLGCS
jgi:hypothetical protein